MVVAADRSKSNSELSDSLATGEALIAEGLITPAQFDISLRQQGAYQEIGNHLYIEQILVRNRFVSKEQIARVVNREAGGGQSGLFQTILSLQTCKRYQVYPLRISNGILDLKSAGPLTANQVKSIRDSATLPISDVRIIPTDLIDIAETLARVTSTDLSFEVLLSRMKTQAVNGVMLRQAFQTVLAKAIELRASDIHIDKKSDPDAWISYRIDGALMQFHLVPARIMAAMFTRLKTECGMDASDDRRAQDGRLSIEHQGRSIDFRVATQPVVGGETMSLRVLDPESLIGLDALFPNQPDMTDLFEKISRIEGKNGGLIFFSGPTGSGKTTSLYALAQQFPRDAVNVLTVEDPVEYVMPFARQIQLNQLLNEKSMNVERSMLRQDPDVLILGEVRDADTMRAALKFAESGHLVLASIHANNAMQTFERVMSFVDGETKNEALFMLTNTLRVIVSQRLVKRLCACAEPIEDSGELLQKANEHDIPVHADGVLRQRKGCPRCRQTGYFGRVASHETLAIPVTESIRARITKLMFGSMQNFNALKDEPGILFKRKNDSLGVLVSTGVIDIETAVGATADSIGKGTE
jgi:type II secretory ATPase GspE/PulE/Tfp pilus assembly ATPase PilB-like protein